MMRARIPEAFGLMFPRMESIGRVKAAVFPVPVWAMPMTSFRRRITGIALAWIGVGSW